LLKRIDNYLSELGKSATEMHDNINGVTPVEQQFGTGDVREAGRAGEGNCLDV